MEARASVFPPWLRVLAAATLVGVAIYTLRGVLTPVFFAFLIAYMLDPIVDRLERFMPRSVAIVVLLAFVLAGLTLGVLLIVPAVTRDVSAFLGDLPHVMQRLLDGWVPVLSEYGIEVPADAHEVFAQLSESGTVSDTAVTPVLAVLRWIVGGTASALGAIAGIVVIPIFAFYLLYDFDRITAALEGLVPWRLRATVTETARDIDQVFGQFVRGQVTVMLALALLYGLGYAVIGLRLALPIGIIAGLLSFIPYVGGAAALGLALLMCVFEWKGWSQVGLVVGVYAVIQALEGFVITPKIVGDKVGLSAVWVLFALLVGSELFGFLGVLLAVPAAAVTKIFVVRGVRAYRASEVFREGAPSELEKGADQPEPPLEEQAADAGEPVDAGEPPASGTGPPNVAVPLTDEAAPVADRPLEEPKDEDTSP